MKLVALEWLKMRRLKVGWLLVMMVFIVVAMSTATPTPDGQTALLGMGMMGAMTGPLFMAVLASRQVEMEHTGSGWLFHGGAGVGKGRVCRAKILALAPLVSVSVLASAGLVIWRAGVAIETGPWLFHVAGVMLVNLVLLSAHVVLSTLLDNQLVSVGIGALGSFLATISLLFPVWAALLHPWGYYALSLPVGTGDEGVFYQPAGWLPLLAFGGISCVALAFALRCIDDRQEA